MPCKRGRTIIPWNAWKFKFWLCCISVLWTFDFGLATSSLDFYVSEDQSSGHLIGGILDELPDAQVPFFLASSVPTELDFSTSTGTIKVKTALDREKKCKLDFVVLSSGSIIEVTVYVNDVNDNSPTFSSSVYEFTPYEGTANDKTKVRAEDPDEGTNSTQHYEIISGNTDNVFELKTLSDSNGIYGELGLAPGKHLDREDTDEYLLNISARDGGSPPRVSYALINITVLDVDDNPPVFSSKEYRVNVSEAISRGTNILNVSASDIDVGQNALIEYAIERGSHSDPGYVFGVNPNTGLIQNNQLLDYETTKSYRIIVVARNPSPSSSQLATVPVVIGVLDENDNDPSISVSFEQPGRYQVLEDADIGTTVARISTSDRDSGSNGEVDVTLEGGNGHFSAKALPLQSTDLILVAKKLDRENQSRFSLKVVAKDRGTVPLTSTYEFIVNVGDINDNPPYFDQAVYHVVVSENVTRNSLVVDLHAIDKDDGLNSELEYTILDDPLNSKFQSWFKINPSLGEIVTASSLDREEISYGVLHVRVSDKGTPPRSANCTVAINITDSNDNNPTFNQSRYQESVVEGSNNGTMVAQVSATDPDTGANGKLQYCIDYDKSKYANLPFHINMNSGIVTTIGIIDHEETPSFGFFVVATDGGGNSGSVEMTVIVTDLNDNKPIFNPLLYNESYFENIPTGHVIAIVNASDKDSGKFAELSYAIVAGDDDGIFDVNLTSGVISLKKSLDREKLDTHTLTIQATDGGGEQADQTATVVITVKDVNDAPPVFTKSLYNFSATENAQPPIFVGVVHASSDDLGINAQISYSIKASNVQDGFVIYPNGSIHLKKTLDHEQIPEAVLVIQAQDGGTPPLYGFANISIRVIDLNDNSPSFHKPEITVEVREDTTVGQTFYTMSANDPDSGSFGTVTYKLLSNPNDTFELHAQSGALSLRHTNAFVWPNTFTVEVLAMDGGSPPNNGTVKLLLKVVDVNDHAPLFVQSSYSVNVSEITSADFDILKVSATDQDTGTNAEVTYSFQPGTGSGDFGLRPDGWIHTKSKLDRETRSIYDLVVVATDRGNPAKSSTAKVVVNVEDVNDNDPKFAMLSYNFLVKEGEDNGTFVGVVSATDRDAGKNSEISYRFATQISEFTIHPSTGEIRTNQVLDREKESSYDIDVVASDAGQNPRTKKVTVTVIVQDINDNSPRFTESSYEKKVYENVPKGSSILAVSARDADKGNNGRVRYSIISGGSSGVFQIDSASGLISLKSNLDRETTDRYVLNIMARDQGIPDYDAIVFVSIYVLDVNDNAPQFLNNSFFVNAPEKLAVGSEVTTVSANDEDEGDNGKVRYVIKSGNSGNTFRMNSTTGRIYLRVKLDYERRDRYQLKIVASDSGHQAKSSELFVTVYVLDANDNRPTFKVNPIVASVGESAPVNHTVATVSADDDDSGVNSKIHYTIEWQSPGPRSFKIHPTTGVVLTTTRLDRESVEQYTLIIKAEDQAFSEQDRLSSTVTLIVNVEDVNDNKPRFVSPSVCYVMEDEPFGFPVLDVLALDPDSKKNGTVEYRLAGGIQREFSLDLASGSLILNEDLDHETTPQYVLNVTATDRGKPPLSSFQLLTVNVVDVNDNPPLFDNRSFSGRVAENMSPGTSVVLVRAVDLDSGSNGAMTYSISSGAEQETFLIDSSTGLITTNVSLDREQKEFYSFTVTVTDNAFPFLVDTASVNVHVLDQNDHPPVFEPDVQSIHVAENKKLADFYSVSAHDRDVGVNEEVVYTIRSGNEDSTFLIGRSTGALSMVSPLDRENRSTYFLQVLAKNVAPPYYEATADLTIHVTDSNDNSPEFDKPSYEATISELTQPFTGILTVRASDADFGSNGAVVYSLMNEDSGVFRIEPSSGDVYTVLSISYRQHNEFSFKCVASDQGDPAKTSSVSVKVLVKDENNHAPKFTQFPFTKSLSPDHTGQVLTVHARDDDSDKFAKITYGFNSSLSSSSALSNFAVDGSSGAVTANSKLANGRYVLYITATDGGSPPLSGYGVIEILVGSVNDDPPKFTSVSPSFASLPENSADGTPVAQVSADKSSVVFRIIDGDPGNPFHIDSGTGAVTVADSAKLDYERDRVFQLYLAVTLSSTNLNGYTTLTVNLTDKNDNAPQLYPANVSVLLEENNTTGSFVPRTIVNLTASDKDSGDNARVVFEIGSGNNNDVFAIDQNTGTVTQVKAVDRETKDAYHLVVLATDRGTPPKSGRSSIRVTVVDVNDNQPIFNGSDVVNVTENHQKGSEIARLSAEDADADSDLVYGFQAGSPSQDVFSIDQFTGAVLLQSPLDYETTKSYRLDVRVSDGVHVRLKTLTVNVLDVNDNVPRFLNDSYKATLPKDTGAGEVVIQVRAVDADSGSNGEVRYFFLTTVDGFKINPVSGVITTTRQGSTNSIHTFVSATDQGTPPQSHAVLVLIQVGGSPTFPKSRYVVSVPEDAKRGTTVVTVNATGEKPDANLGKINYKIIDGDTFKNFQIGLRDGVIKINNTLDYEVTKQYFLVVSAGEGDGNTATTTVNITVQDVNDNAPRFVDKQYSGELREDVDVDTSVVTVSATDRDSGAAGRVRYSIQSGNDKGSFKIDAVSGELRTAATLDHESIKRYHLSVEARDQGTPPKSSVVPVKVRVIDLNDNAPEFEIPNPEDVAVLENAPVGASVYRANAKDRDSDSFGRVSYSITGGTGQGLFLINEKTGLITTNATFDYESGAEYSLDLKAVDGSEPPMEGKITLTVLITSVDEYRPTFLKNDYKFDVPGNAEVGTIIGQVSASDDDGGPDGVVVYSLENPSRVFAINSTSGEVYVSAKLEPASARKRRSTDESRRVRRASDPERHNLGIVASSGREGSKKATALVKVDVDYGCAGCTGGPGTNEETYSSKALNLIVGLAAVAGILVICIVVVFAVYCARRRKKQRPHRAQRETFDGSFDEITVHPASNGIANHVDSSLETLSPTRRLSHANDYTPVNVNTDPSSGQRTDSSGTPNSASSSGRGSTEGDGEYGIVNDVGSVNSENNGKTTIPDSGIQQDADQVSQVTISDGESSMLQGDGYSTERYDKILARLESQESLHVFGEEGGGEAHGGVHPRHLLSAKLAEVDADEDESIIDGPQPYADEGRGQPSYGGSLSSIVGSQEELTESYNWDYLLDWGPKFQPLADVFLEIGRMKDDVPAAKPLAARLSIPSSRSGRPVEVSGRRTTDMLSSVSSLPRSPISPPSTQYTSPAFSPNFTPAITPLVTRSPSVSPLDTGVSTPARLSLHGSAPHLSRPSSMNVERSRRDSQTSELTHSPSISDSESNLEVDV